MSNIFIFLHFSSSLKLYLEKDNRNILSYDEINIHKEDNVSGMYIDNRKELGKLLVKLENCEIDEAELISSTREHLSGYKLPKSIIFVSEVMRAPNGKADYKWAKKIAEAELI